MSKRRQPRSTRETGKPTDSLLSHWSLWMESAEGAHEPAKVDLVFTIAGEQAQDPGHQRVHRQLRDEPEIIQADQAALGAVQLRVALIKLFDLFRGNCVRTTE